MKLENKKTLTWDEIYNAAIDCGFKEPELVRKDYARSVIVEFIKEKLGIDLEKKHEHGFFDCIDDCLDEYAEKYCLVFDEKGNLLRSSM